MISLLLLTIDCFEHDSDHEQKLNRKNCKWYGYNDNCDYDNNYDYFDDNYDDFDDKHHHPLRLAVVPWQNDRPVVGTDNFAVIIIIVISIIIIIIIIDHHHHHHHHHYKYNQPAIEKLIHKVRITFFARYIRGALKVHVKGLKKVTRANKIGKVYSSPKRLK